MKNVKFDDTITYTDEEVFNILVKRDYHHQTHYRPDNIIDWYKLNRKKIPETTNETPK